MSQLAIAIWFCLLAMTCLAVAKRNNDESDDEHLYVSQNNKRGRASTRWPTFDTWNSANDVKPASSTSAASASQTAPFADNIRCNDKDGMQSFTANIMLPMGYRSVPVFEDAAGVNPTVNEECNMKQTSMGSGMFLMKITNFVKCGVTQQKGNDGKEWLAVSVRFPFVGGLRTAEDEHVLIMCRPQERTITQNHVMDYRSNLSNLPKTIFSSSSSELDTKVSLFVKKSGVSGYSEELARSSVIEVGQDIQFRAVVRAGDGWKYAKLKELTIQRIGKNAKDEESTLNLFNIRKRTVNGPGSSGGSGGNLSGRTNKPKRTDSTMPNVAYLVLEDGCRNPIYSSIAPRHPFKDQNNPLAINFNFKAFMFQDMTEGDTLRVLAKVMACQDQVDCQPTQCLDDDKLGYGRRRRRWAAVDDRSVEVTTSMMANPNNSSPIISEPAHHDEHLTENFWRDFEFQVVMPGYGQALAVRSASSAAAGVASQVTIGHHRRVGDDECRSVVILSTGLSVVFIIAATVAALVAMRAKHPMRSDYYDQ